MLCLRSKPSSLLLVPQPPKSADLMIPLTAKNLRDSERSVNATTAAVATSSPPSESSSTSSGVSDMSDGSSSGYLSGGHRGLSPAVSSCGTMEMVEESETSDYQRSTPSPREGVPFKAVMVRDEFLDPGQDLGFGDDYKSPSSSSSFGYSTARIKTAYSGRPGPACSKEKEKDADQECKFSVMAAIANNRLSVEDRLALIRDPKIMRSKVQVQIEKLPVKELSPNMVVTVSEDLFARVNVSPKRENRNGSSGNDNCWFARKATQMLFQPPSSPQQLIRPAVLTVSPSKPEKTGKFSSDDSSEAASSSDISTTNNPFLPPLKSSYLFGFNDDFECVPPEELIVSDDEEEEEEDEEDLEEEDDVTKEGFEESMLPSSIIDVKCRDEMAPSSGSETNNEQSPNAEEEDKFAKPALLLGNGENPHKTVNPIKLRFPALHGTKNMIECKWKGCQMTFTTYGKLSDHLKAGHVVSQVCQQMRKESLDSGNGEMYQCLWEGCKVFAKKSCSRSWLEKHVPTHGGKFAFACIVSGCKQRFSSQKMLQRHVNSHFSGGALSNGCCKPSSKTDQSESTKNLRRAGVKLKYRRTVFSARIFDMFDTGVMAAIKHSVHDLEAEKNKRKIGLIGDYVTFRSRVVLVRTERDGSRTARVTWEPEDLLDDEWLPIERVQATKSIKICHLPEIAKVKLHSELYGPRATTSTVQSGGGNRRKSKATAATAGTHLKSSDI